MVHRGVSQGGRNLDALERMKFWAKKASKKVMKGGIAGIKAVFSKNFKEAKFIISPEGLRNMRKFSLVIVSNPEKPAVWTPDRILKSAPRSSSNSLENGQAEKAIKIRDGNFYCEIIFLKAWLVHRGASYGGRDLTSEQREKFWSKNNRLYPKIKGIEKKCENLEGINLDIETFRISLEGLRIMREKSFVIVSDPENPKVWTPKRILKSAKRVRNI